MAAVAGVRRVVVVAVVAGIAICFNGNVRSGYGPELVMIESGRRPGILRVALFTIRREIRSYVIRVAGGCVIIVVAAIAGVGRIVVVAVVAGHTVVCNGYVRTLKLPVLVVVKCGWRPF